LAGLSEPPRTETARRRPTTRPALSALCRAALERENAPVLAMYCS
jgi:hypothetical protein